MKKTVKISAKNLIMKKDTGFMIDKRYIEILGVGTEIVRNEYDTDYKIVIYIY